MSFQLQCTNKGCYETSAAELDKETNLVHCLICGDPIVNITAITKNQLKFQGQVKKPSKKGESYGIKCEVCQAQRTPTIDGKKFFCSECKAEMKNIPYPFQVLLRNKGAGQL